MTSTQDRKTLLLYAPSLFCLRLFLRLRKGLHERGWETIFVSHRVSVWLNARAAGATCILLRWAVAGEPTLFVPIDDTPVVKLKRLSSERARRVGDSVHQALCRICDRSSIHAIGLWNGGHLEGRVATAFAHSRELKTVYFELGNIERKLFVDPEGVNAASRLAHERAILDRFSITDMEIADWYSNLNARSSKKQTVPQAESLIRRRRLWALIDRISVFLFCVPQPMPRAAGQTIWRRINERRQPVPEIRPTGLYIFLPLQVSNDTNLLLFSHVDSLGAIKQVAKRAREQRLQLVIKPHPAEHDMAFLSKVTAICKEKGYLLTKWNVTDLVRNAEEVFVINSSVGLEAIALGKKLTILGEAFYRNFSAKDVATYALKYLLDFDPFGSKPASEAVIDRIVALLEAK